MPLQCVTHMRPRVRLVSCAAPDRLLRVRLVSCAAPDRLLSSTRTLVVMSVRKP